MKESDPAAFKQTLEDASKKLADKAATESDPEKAKHLQEMSAKFAEAAKTGDLSALKPPDHKGPPPPPPPATGSSGGGAAQTFDPADANVDGKVTQQEQEAYDARKQVAKAVQTYQQATTQAASSAQEAVLATLAS